MFEIKVELLDVLPELFRYPGGMGGRLGAGGGGGHTALTTDESDSGFDKLGGSGGGGGGAVAGIGVKSLFSELFS